MIITQDIYACALSFANDDAEFSMRLSVIKNKEADFKAQNVDCKMRALRMFFRFDHTRNLSLTFGKTCSLKDAQHEIDKWIREGFGN